MCKPIVFYDSGIGGIPYLTHLKDLLPFEEFIYVADNKNFPYGEKSEDVLLRIIIKLIKNIETYLNPKVIVIACNTATVTALDILRTLTKVPLVGVVPAIKTASSLTKNNKIGILATNRTAKGEYLRVLIKSFSLDKEVFCVGASGIVNFVEKEYYKSSPEHIDHFIKKSIKTIEKHSVDTVVLGCTHFIHVAQEIKNALGSGVIVIDSREGVSNQVIRVLPNKTKKEVFGKAFFYLTQKIENCDNYISLCSKFKLEYMGEIKNC